MAGMFQIALDAQEPLRLDPYGFQDMKYEDEDYALRCLVKEGSVGEVLDLYDETRRRINTWANGLLECKQGNKVDFLHQTVRDLFRTGDMLSYLEAKRRPDFDVYLSITKAYVAHIKSARFSDGIFRLNPPNHNSGMLIDRLIITWQHALKIAADWSDKVSELLDELDVPLTKCFE
ncbi:Uncharacterized protein LW93_4913 [Fusarium fujikuroi]|nr:Uncharacterized protein LW93_4913 [Fusarium fujikuroi]